MNSPHGPSLAVPGLNVGTGGSPKICGMNEVKKTKQRWLIEGWLPRGATCVLEGRKTAGKSTLAAAFAAWVTGGPAVPGVKRMRGRNVLWMAGEESVYAETKPKLVAAGARMRYVKTFSSFDQAAFTRTPKFPGDFGWLIEQIQRFKFKLIVLDPIRSFIDPCINMQNEQQMGGIMEVLTKVGDKFDVCIIAMRNMKKGRSKDPLDEGINSVAIGNVSRSILRVIPGESKQHWSTLRTLATNFGVERADHQFKIVSAGDCWRVEWGKAVQSTADDDPLGEMDEGQQLEANVAEELARHLLKDGPRRGDEIYRVAEREKINRMAMWRTLKKLKCGHKRHGNGDQTYTEWWLPKQEGGKRSKQKETKKKKTEEKRENP